MKLPSHTTVIAYLALFVALGGSAYAVTQLPKNSVGAKQLKSNAVTTAKIKNGAVTGAKIKNGAVTGAKIATDTVTGANVDESTLGRVPSAGSAQTAATAGHANTAATAGHANTAATAGHAGTAGNASTLDGVPGSGFLRTDAVQFGSGALNACFAQQLVEVPGWFRIETVGDCQNEFKFRVTNLSPETWTFMSQGDATSVGESSSSVLGFPTNFSTIDLFAISSTDPNKHALIDCAYQASTAPPRISCSTRIPPAA